MWCYFEMLQNFHLIMIISLFFIVFSPCMILFQSMVHPQCPFKKTYQLTWMNFKATFYYLFLSEYFSQDLYKLPTHLNDCTIEVIHEITHQMENVFNSLANQKEQCKVFPGSPVTVTTCSQCRVGGGPVSTLGWRIRSHMPQLRVRILKT